jgi:hypothetical protein
MEKEEVGTASIPALGDVAGVLEGAAPGPRWWKAPDHVWRSDDVQPRREGTCRVSFGLDYITMLLLFGEGG